MAEQNNSQEELLQEIEKLKHQLAVCKQAASDQFSQTTENQTINSILNVVPHAVIGLINRKIVFANKAVKAVFNIDRESIIGQSNRMFYRSDQDFQRIADIIYQVLEGKECYAQEFPCRTSDGRDIICNVSAARLGNELTKQAIVVMYENLTEAKQAEKDQILFTALMEQSRDAILFISLESARIIYANKEACESLGYAKADLLAKTVLDIDPLFNPESWAKHVQLIKESKPEMLLSTMHRRRDGVQFPVEVSIKFVSFEQNNYLISIARDISERKKIEAELKQSATEWHRTFDALDELIFIQDLSHVIVRVNKAFAKHLGLEPKQIEGKKCYELMHKQDSVWSECPMEFTKKDQQSHTAEVDDPQIGLPLRITTSPIFDQDGQMVGAVHIAKDISQEREATKELKRKMHDLEIFRKSAVGREMKMMEMKKKIQDLENQCKQ
ncbi:MAG: PAS domain-containing protein [Candidatus Omnitrophica bacterium]|nr:PAS domain-containing protein [Candidatus Omnitrophota bacterium]